MISNEKMILLMDKFMDSPENISKNFGGAKNFLNFIMSKGFAHLINPSDQFWYDEGLQDFIIGLQYQNSENKEEYLRNFTQKFLDSDIDIVGDKIIWVTDKDDLLRMFDDRGRDATAKSLAKLVFTDEDNDFYFDDTIYNFYDNCIENLNSENKKILIDKILSEGIELTTNDIESVSLFEELWEVAGQPEKLLINNENINTIFDDEDAMMYLLDNYFEDIKGQLSSNYNQAYNTAYSDELYNLVYNGLFHYFGDKGEEVNINQNKPGSIPNYRYRIDITSSFKRFFEDYFLRSSHYNDIEYFGSFLNMMEELFDYHEEKIDFRIPDYPDYIKIKDNYNEYFYIY